MHKIAQTGAISPPKITVEMTAKNMTVNAGLLPVFRFMNKLQLDRLIQQLVKTPPRAENASYQLSDVVSVIIAGQIAGATAMTHVAKICSDEVVAKMAGWVDVPVATTYTRIISAVKDKTRCSSFLSFDFRAFRMANHSGRK